MKKTNLIWMIGIIFIISLGYANAAEGGGGGGGGGPTCYNIGQACSQGGTPCCGHTTCTGTQGDETCQCLTGKSSCQDVCPEYPNYCHENPTPYNCGCGDYSDPCEGVTCNNPPQCRTSDGASCSGGLCTYPPNPEQNNLNCDDGLYCTIDDKCSNGNCAGTARNCGANSYCDETSDSCKCNSGFTKCGTVCVNTLTDRTNCGSCGNVCLAYNICSNGQCVYSATCGDGILNENEECDAEEFGGATCASYGFYSGSLSCSGCVISSSGCHAGCGNGHCEIGEDNYNCLMDCALPGWTFTAPSQPSFIQKIFGIEKTTTLSGWVGSPNFNLNKTRFMSAPHSIMAHLNTSDGQAMYSQEINLIPGKYIISAGIWNNLSEGNAYIDFNDEDHNLNPCEDLFSTLQNNNWETIKCQFTVTEERSTTIRLVIDGCSNNTDCGYAWFDNISLIRIEETPNIPTILDTYDFTQQGCCPQNWCWNGTACMNSSLWEENTSYPPIFAADMISGYRCIAGNWVYSEAKWDWNFDKKGFCQAESQCFVGEDYEGAVKGCIEDGYFVGDHYCWNGTWSSRTKYLTTQLLKFIEKQNSNDFVLYCDNYTNVLNDIEYNSPIGQKNIKDYMDGNQPALGCSANECICDKNGTPETDNCVNNICALKWKEDGKYKVVLGATLNQEINATEYPFLDVLNKSANYCNNVISNNHENFSACSGSDVWYYPSKQAVIFGKQDIASLVNPQITAWNAIWNWIKSLFTTPFKRILIDETMNVTNFNTLYIAQNGNNWIFGVKEMEKEMKFAKIIYKLEKTGNVICPKINTPLSCSYNSSEKLTTIAYEENPLFVEITQWKDLTSKLRLKKGTSIISNE